ncbi:MAG: rhomboid family intramembrane serine protease [Lachnospiraceae bacterium]|nr:rhomboid family intramembrane serine protease [Lachnospiraceae bacterium]
MTYILIAVNVLVFLLEAAAGGSEDVDVAIRFGAYVMPLVRDRGEWYRLFTAMFLHFGPEHLGSNMISLFALGSFVERCFGKVRFLVIYLVSGLAGNLLVYVTDILSGAGGTAVSAGASGAICGLLGVFIVFALLPQMKGMFPMKRVLIAVLLVLAPGLSDGSINMTAHIGGLIGGFLITWPVYFSTTALRRR